MNSMRPITVNVLDEKIFNVVQYSGLAHTTGYKIA